MQLELFKSSWATNEGFEALRNQLDDLVPLSGRCKNPRSTNKKLDKFRVAQNLIHDLFNNGLCNRKAHFRQFFGWAPYAQTRHYQYSHHDWKRFEEELEPTFTQIIQEAANEQKRLGNL
tara:strand:+ start:143 stop:499 length:357 start_codon:yes stop_codon:yes gene_type:complete